MYRRLEQEPVKRFWDQVQDYPAIIETYSEIPLVLFMRARKPSDEQRLNLRQENLITLTKERYGLGVPRRPYLNMVRKLGVANSTFYAFTEATLLCLSEDTQIDLPHPTHVLAQTAQHRIRNIMVNFQTLKESLTEPDGPTELERMMIELYLSGKAVNVRTIAEDLGTSLHSDFLNSRAVYRLLENAQHKAYYEHPARVSQRAFQAKKVLESESAGSYVNHKTKMTEKILELLYEGASRDEVLAQLGINLNSYKALVNEVFIELNPPLVKKNLNPMEINRMAKQLLRPFQLFRQQLGEGTNESGQLTHRLLSVRERAILERVTEAATDQDLEKQFNTDQFKIGAVAKWLIGNVEYTSRDKRLDERKRLAQQFKEDVTTIPHLLPQTLFSINSLPTEIILDLLAQNKTYPEVSQIIAQFTGRRILPWRINQHFARLRAFYQYLREPLFSKLAPETTNPRKLLEEPAAKA